MFQNDLHHLKCFILVFLFLNMSFYHMYWFGRINRFLVPSIHKLCLPTRIWTLLSYMDT